jgi:hypothetical protein
VNFPETGSEGISDLMLGRLGRVRLAALFLRGSF